MIDPRIFDYIDDDKQEDCYKSLLISVYYFYHNKRPKEDQEITLLDGNKWNLDRNNILIYNKIN